MDKQENIYYLETADGQLMRVPESKLGEFQRINERRKAERKQKEKQQQRNSLKKVIGLKQMDMEKKIQAKNWDGTKILVKMKHLPEWSVWDMYNRKHQIHPTQSEFTEAEFLPKHLRPSAAKQATTEEQH